LRRVRPPRAETLEDIALWSVPSPEPDFFSLNSIAASCRHVFNWGRLLENEDGHEGWYFCKTDYLDSFFAHHAPETDFVLFSGNSDLGVGRREARHLRRKELVAWFAANLEVRRPRLHALPIGIANLHPSWPNGDAAAIRLVRDEQRPKTRLFHAGFALHTNPRERERCLAQTGVPHDRPAPFEEYLEQLASSWFCLAPRGKGLDTHRVWEALYLRTIPVLKRSVLTEQHADLPLVVLDDWRELRSLDLSPQAYERIWGDWDPQRLSLRGYLERIGARLAEAGAPEALARIDRMERQPR
jgi:hypothetical protein